MSYTNGNEYIIKSMNGIKTFDDGSGTIIENGEINTTIMTSDEIKCAQSLTCPSVITDFIGSETNLSFLSSASTLYDFTILTKTASENSTKAASTAFVNTAINNLLSGTNTWTGTTNTFNNSIIVPTKTAGDNSTNASSTAFVNTAISNFKSANNTWGGGQDFISSSVSVKTQTLGDSTNSAASTAFVGSAISNLKGATGTTNYWTDYANDFSGFTTVQTKTSLVIQIMRHLLNLLILQ